MAYKKEEIYKRALDIIKNKEVLFINDVIAFLPCGRSAFYEFFPKKSDESDTLKRELEQKKVKQKIMLRKFFGCKLASASERIFLYKLLANDEERQAIYGSTENIAVDPPTHEIILTHEPSETHQTKINEILN